MTGVVLICLAGCWRGVGRQPLVVGAAGSGLSVVREFVDRFGTRRVETLTNMFTEDAVVEIRGLAAVIQGRSGVRDLAEYAAVVKSRLRMTEYRAAEDTVWAELVETNEWLRITGVNELRYRALFRMRLGRLEEVVLEIEPESRELLKERLMNVLLSLLKEEPETVERLMPGGRLSFNRRAASELLWILRERFRGQR